MSQSTWDGIRFAAPAGFVDQTVLTFLDKPDHPTLSVTMSQEPLAGGKPALLRYVDEQLAEIKRAVPLYRVVQQAERALAAGPALHLSAVIAERGRNRSQSQLYVLDEKRGRVFVATVTAPEGDARAARVLDDLGASLRFDAA